MYTTFNIGNKVCIFDLAIVHQRTHIVMDDWSTYCSLFCIFSCQKVDKIASVFGDSMLYRYGICVVISEYD